MNQDGEHTIEPLTDSALKTIAVTRYSRENPEGNVHLAGALQLEAHKNHLAIESKPRHRQADRPEDELNVQMRKPSAKTKAKAGLAFRAGQGLNPAGPDPSEGIVKSKNNNRRRGGGRRNREEEEEQKAPEITLVFSPK